jgi:hypothetical protein
VTRDELLALVDRRADAVRAYLEWAREHDEHRLEARPDIPAAAEAARMFPKPWWGLVVFTCFGALRGAEVVAPRFQRPLPPPEAEAVLAGIDFPPRSLGEHRTRPGFRGAKRALVSACADHGLFREVLHSRDDFDTRFRRLCEARMPEWGCMTCFDLLLRAGALGVGGRRYGPEYAYFGDSTGPKAGFREVWGVELRDAESVAWAEALLRAWAEEWDEVARRVGVEWAEAPLQPCDQENFLCIYHEER